MESVAGPYLQSERKEIYQAYAKSLIAKGLAYPCFCSAEEIEEMRKVQRRIERENRLHYGSLQTVAIFLSMKHTRK